MRALPLLLLVPLASWAQPLATVPLTALSTTLDETSGLLIVDGAVWTHNDSGNRNELYQLDTLTGVVLRTVRLDNAANTDWEDLASDGRWVYVGDFGNNSGSRRDLRVYRFPLADLRDPAVTNVTVDTIRFTFADQTIFTPANNANDFDCEAMVAMDDSLFLFSKNWLDQRTRLYALPAVPGDHAAVVLGSLDAQGLVTGAAWDPQGRRIALVGYTGDLATPFVWELAGFRGHDFFGGSAQRHELALAFIQMEGIAWVRPGEVFLSSEMNFLAPARLWSLRMGLTTGTAGRPDRTVRARAGDGGAMLLEGPPTPARLGLYDALGRLALRRPPAMAHLIARGDVPPGVYTVVLALDGESWRGTVVLER